MGRFDGVLLLSDMDGTLLNAQNQLGDENQEAARYFMEQGGLFSVATGRVKRAMEFFLPRLELNAPAVLFNGSVVYDFAKGAPVQEHCMEHGGALEFAWDLLGRYPDLGLEVFLAEDEYVARSNEITRKHFEFVRLPLKECPIDQIPQPWIKFNLTDEPQRLQQVAAYCQKTYSDRYFMEFSMPYFFEVMMGRANKGTAALAVCQHCGISPQHLYAMGDNYNDKELLACAHRAFAPSNAVPEILAMAHHVLPHHDVGALPAAIDILEKLY